MPKSSPAADQSINISTRLTSPGMERLAKELSLARAEIASLREQCDELRILATDNNIRRAPDTPKFGSLYEVDDSSKRFNTTATWSMTGVELPKSTLDGGRGDADLTPMEADKPRPQVHSSSAAAGGRCEDIDKMSCDDARQALKVIFV